MHRKKNARCQKDTRDARLFSSCLTWPQYAGKSPRASIVGSTIWQGRGNAQDLRLTARPAHAKMLARRIWGRQMRLIPEGIYPPHRGQRFARDAGDLYAYTEGVVPAPGSSSTLTQRAGQSFR